MGERFCDVGGAISYVYILTDASLLQQSVCVLEAERTLGRGPWQSFSGHALITPKLLSWGQHDVMETLIDFGTVDYFGLHTLVSVYKTMFQ